MTLALVVPSDGEKPLYLTVIDGDALTDVYRHVGCDVVEAIRPTYEGVGWHAYVDEEGALKGLPRNVRASVLAYACGRPEGSGMLVGDAVFLGENGSGEGDVPWRVVIAVKELDYELEEEQR